MSDLQPMTIWAATPDTPVALTDAANERVRQVTKWGVQTRPNGTSDGPFQRDVAQWAKDATDRAAADGTLNWRLILDEEVAEAFAEVDPAKLREELVQVAAVALSWVEDLDRKARAGLREALGPDGQVARDIEAGRLPLKSPGES